MFLEFAPHLWGSFGNRSRREGEERHTVPPVVFRIPRQFEESFVDQDRGSERDAGARADGMPG